jgi:hypothetical protein
MVASPGLYAQTATRAQAPGQRSPAFLGADGKPLRVDSAAEQRGSVEDTGVDDILAPIRTSRPRAPRAVRLALSVHSPRTSSRALLTRQRTPYGLRRLFTGGVPDLDLPSASIAEPGAELRSQLAAARAAVADAKLAPRSSQAPEDGRPSPGCGRAHVRFGPRFLDVHLGDVPTSMDEELAAELVASPRTTAPALLARQATPCPLRWNESGRGWGWDDAGSEAGLTPSCGNSTALHAYDRPSGAERFSGMASPEPGLLRWQGSGRRALPGLAAAGHSLLTSPGGSLLPYRRGTADGGDPPAPTSLAGEDSVGPRGWSRGERAGEGRCVAAWAVRRTAGTPRSFAAPGCS